MYGYVIGNSAGTEDRLAGAVIVDVTTNGAVQRVNRAFVQFDAGLLFDPGFELRIRRLARFDEMVDDGITVEAKAVDDHFWSTASSAAPG